MAQPRGGSMTLEKRQAKLRKTVLGELQFMLHHFTQMLKAASKGNSSLMIAGNHSRLSSFIPHLQQTIDQLHAPLASEEALDKLELHLERTLLPVKRRLEAQLRQTLPQPHLAASGSSGELSKCSEPAAVADEVAPLEKPVVSDDEAEMLGDLFVESDRRRRRKPSWDDEKRPVVTESSDSSDSASVHGKTTEPVEAPLPHPASAPALGSSPRPPPPAALRRRASIQVLPERVEYHCSSCGEVYTARSSTIYNPWWSLVRQACPKCDQCQFPWIDISSATNQITHRPCAALEEDALKGADDDDDDLLKDDSGVVVGGGGNEDDDDDDDDQHLLLLGDGARTDAGQRRDGECPRRPPEEEASSQLYCGEEDDCRFAEAPEPDRLTRDQATAVLDLFQHARACPGTHCSRRHANLCLASKYVMLHARDCRGALPCGRPCPFPWCRAIKRVLAHLVRCADRPGECLVCHREAARGDDLLPAKRRLDDADADLIDQPPRLESRLVEPVRNGVPRVVIRKPRPDDHRTHHPPPRKLQRPSFDYWETLNGVIDAPSPGGGPSVDALDDAALSLCADTHCAIVG